MARDRKRAGDGVEVLMKKKEREEYKIEIKEKTPVNECIKIQTGGQDESLSIGVSGKETELINLHANSTVATGTLCITLKSVSFSTCY